MSRNNPWVLGALVFLLAGCTPTLDHTQIKMMAANVYTGDGVDRHEAILLGQDFIVRQSLYDRLISLEPFRVTERVEFLKDGKPIIYAVAPKDRTGIVRKRTWSLYFRDKRYTFLEWRPTIVPFKVVVDADTGAIVDWGLDDLRPNPDIYSYEKVYEGSRI